MKTLIGMIGRPLPLKLNLQLFAEGDGGGAADAGGADGGQSFNPQAEGATPGWGLPEGHQRTSGAELSTNPLFSDVNFLAEPEAVKPNPEPAPVQPAAEPTVFDFAGRKIEVTDPNVLAVLQDVHKDYTNLQSTYTQTSQQAKTLEQERNTLMNLVQQSQQQQSPAPQPQNQQPTPEQLEQQKAEFMDRFYEDPLGAMTSILDQMFQQKVQPVIEPISQQQHWNEQIQKISAKYEDFQTLSEPIQAVLNEMPELLKQGGLEAVYHVAKGRAAAEAAANAVPATPPPTPEQLMSDPNFVQQYVLNNPQIQQQIVQGYLNNKLQTNAQTPMVMGGQPGGQPPAMPENRPKTLREASKAFLNSWANQ